ncbi:MAG: hypothetical protein Kow00124_29850 [Anaerolineae bacterium]
MAMTLCPRRKNPLTCQLAFYPRRLWRRPCCTRGLPALTPNPLSLRERGLKKGQRCTSLLAPRPECPLRGTRGGAQRSKARG